MITQRTLQISAGLSVQVSEAGRGAEVVCLHAGVADRRMWEPQQRALAEHWRVVAYDRRGFGGTRSEPGTFSQVGDLIALLDALQIDAAVLMGCSQGGRIAIDTALAHPRRVRALVLVAAAISGAPAWDELPAELLPRFAELEAAEACHDLHTVNRLEAEFWLDGPLQPPGRVGGALRGLFLDMNGSALAAPSPGDASEPPSAWDRLQELRVPTLVLWGPYDFELLQSTMRHLVARVPGARGEVIEGTAHLPGLERPDVVNAVLRRFLDAL